MPAFVILLVPLGADSPVQSGPGTQLANNPSDLKQILSGARGSKP